MIFLIVTLSNAGGLSGAGTNVPIIVVFFGMSMMEAISASSIIGIVTTVLRFIIGYN
jgi:uncharacterized membrane protein YfcA